MSSTFTLVKCAPRIPGFFTEFCHKVMFNFVRVVFFLHPWGGCVALSDLQLLSHHYTPATWLCVILLICCWISACFLRRISALCLRRMPTYSFPLFVVSLSSVSTGVNQTLWNELGSVPSLSLNTWKNSAINTWWLHLVMAALLGESFFNSVTCYWSV